ncbi:uncharacterized protein DC041_0008187 [Schistosoma bovis]|uniref:DNA mismatch repair protein MutS connector domain-containing protein n=1 Tax=Schistosoma bovis TaxID=6184 RepID=A0A430Q960_SCHBO|nr:uncharacterized protein DC041_0008187 [Schistosoma bovis]
MFLIFVIGVNYSIKQDNCSVFQHVCLAFCETESRKFLVGEFMDSVHLANLETALVQLKTRECLVPTGLLSHPDISKSDVTPLGNAISEHVSFIFEKTGILPTEVKKCKSCTSLNAFDTNRHVFTLETFSLENHVRLDSAASRALHLLPGPDDSE